jgi:hypothetical protein
MDLLQSLLQGAGPGAIKNIAAQLGIDENQANSAISALLPALQNASGDHVQAAAQAASSSGLDAGLLAQLAPILNGLLAQGGAQGGLLGAVTSMLDADKDGSAADDILGMAQNFFDKK